VAQWPGVQCCCQSHEIVLPNQVEYETALNDYKLKKKQDPTKLFDHFIKVNTQFGITAPDENKLITWALKKLQEKYGQTFSTMTISLGRQVDLKTFREAASALH
jgi:hypothetical protein